MRLAVPILILLVFSGCRTHLVLRDRTLETAATLVDLNYQQVIDNVARFVSNPAVLPSVAVVNGGNVLVSDQGSLGGAGTYSPTITALDQIGGFPIFNLFVNPSVSRNVTENWAMVPVTDIEKVRRLRCAFQLLVGGVECSECDDCLKTLEGFIPVEPEKLSCSIPMGWFCVGKKADVPKEACYVGHYCETYVWVMPEGVDGLSRFTMTIMQLSTSELDDSPTKTIVKKYNAEGKLEGTEVTTEEPDEDAADRGSFKETGLHLREVNPAVRQKHHGPTGLTPKQTAITPKQARKRPGIPSSPSP